MIATEKVIDFRAHLRHFEREIEIQNTSNCCCGVTLTQCHTLMELDKQDNVSLKDLSERLYLDKSTLSRIVEGLVNLGLVDREIPKKNRRTILIKLTKQGISVCKKINTDNNLYFKKVLDSLSQEQLQIFLDSFKAIVSKMIEMIIMKIPAVDFNVSNGITLMDKVKNATDLYKQGYLCSQSVFAAFCEDYGIDKELGLKLSKFLGFGYLFRGDYCGAISAALMIYGLKYSSVETYSDLSDELFYQLSKEHIRRFEEKNGFCQCNELLNGDVSTGEGIQLIREKGYFDSKCPAFVKDSAEILTQLLKKMEQRGSKDYFEKVADEWDNMQESFFSVSARNKAFEIAKIKSNDTIADIGAGTGYITEGLINKKVKVIAVDQSPSMLKEMQKKFSKIDNIDYRVGDSENLPIKDSEVNFAFANMYLHHVDNPEKSIKEMTRILKKGGRLIVTDLDKHTHEFLKTEQFDKWLGFDRNELRKWFESAGLKNIVIDCVGDKCCADSQCQQTDRAEISIFIGYGEK